ncbi:MAG TPA: hypothetical protein VFV66_09435 [Nonomuraea sp.]|nr:hypothetical protein [Nonomuraea sp.]
MRLPDQDRGLWDRQAIEQATALLTRAARAPTAGRGRISCGRRPWHVTPGPGPLLEQRMGWD